MAWCEVSLPIAGGLELHDLIGSFQPTPFYDFVMLQTEWELLHVLNIVMASLLRRYIKKSFSTVDVRAEMTLLRSQFFKIQRKQLEVAEVWLFSTFQLKLQWA